MKDQDSTFLKNLLPSKSRQAQVISRRDFLRMSALSAGSLFVIGANVGCGRQDAEDSLAGPQIKKASLPPSFENAELQANVFVAINAAGDVFIICSRSEMGQGVRTGVPLVIADELEADWQRVYVVQGDGDKKYGNQNTDGSTSIRQFFDKWRTAGAAAKQMLVQAAAKKWQVPLEECKAELHQVKHEKSKRVLEYGELAELAMQEEVPDKPSLKSPQQWRYIGTSVNGIDNEAIAQGSAKFGADIKLPGMLYASIERCPTVGGRVKTLDISKAMEESGVLQVVEIPALKLPAVFQPLGGVAVVANNSWVAIKAREKLSIDWEFGQFASADTQQSRENMQASVSKPGKNIKSVGDIEKALASSAKLLEASYHTPMMSHSPMEPCNCVAWVKNDGSCEIWAPTQTPQSARKQVAAALGTSEEKVTVHVTLLGGAFGRKAKPDFIVEAALISKAMIAPVQCQWTREDDTKFSYYHAPSVQYLKGGLDEQGRLTAWLHRTSFPGIKSTFEKGAEFPDEWELGGGFSTNPYVVSAMKLENCAAKSHVRIGWFRSVASNQHAFVVNAFAAECALAAKRDQKEFFLELLGPTSTSLSLSEEEKDSHDYNAKRMKGVLLAVCESIGYGKKLPKGHAIGLAVHWSFQSYTAHAIEVSMVNGALQIHDVHAALDCGVFVNRDRILAQMEGGTLMGLSWAMHSEITTQNGAVQQSNFHDYPLMRMNEAPDVQVTIIESGAKPGGAGEPGITSAPPALTNAILQITNKPVRRLPLSAS